MLGLLICWLSSSIATCKYWCKWSNLQSTSTNFMDIWIAVSDHYHGFSRGGTSKLAGFPKSGINQHKICDVPPHPPETKKKRIDYQSIVINELPCLKSAQHLGTFAVLNRFGTILAFLDLTMSDFFDSQHWTETEEWLHVLFCVAHSPVC